MGSEVGSVSGLLGKDDLRNARKQRTCWSLVSYLGLLLGWKRALLWAQTSRDPLGHRAAFHRVFVLDGISSRCGFGNSPVVARGKVRGPGRSLPLTAVSEFPSGFLVNSIVHGKAVSSCPNLSPFGPGFIEADIVRVNWTPSDLNVVWDRREHRCFFLLSATKSVCQ